MDIAKGLFRQRDSSANHVLPTDCARGLMVEPTETESKEALDEAIEVFRRLYETAKTDPQSLHEAPHHTAVRRLDEVGAARNQKLRYLF